MVLGDGFTLDAIAPQTLGFGDENHVDFESDGDQAVVFTKSVGGFVPGIETCEGTAFSSVGQVDSAVVGIMAFGNLDMDFSFWAGIVVPLVDVVGRSWRRSSMHKCRRAQS